MDEYNEFKKTFTNRVDLAGQSLAKDEDSLIASDTPVSAEKSADQEIKMDNQNIDLEAFAKQVAEDTAAKIAMKQAEQKAAEEAKAKAAQEAEEAKALEAESIKTVINSGVESGVEKLMSDVEAKLSEKDAKMDEVIQSFQKELEEKKAEIAAMQSSKKDFSGRGKGDLTAFGKEFLQAKILGEITGKGFNTDYARDLQEKTVSITTNDGTTVGLDTTISSAFAYEVQAEYKVAQLFEELAVNSGATVLPFAAEPDLATFSNEGISKSNAADQNLLQDGGSNYAVTERILNAKRLIAGTFINGDTDEQTVVNLLPMLTRQLAVAHARAIDSAILIGNSSIKGLTGQGVDGTGTGTGGYAGSGSDAAGYATNLAETIDVSSGADSTNHVSDTQLLSMRGEMGKYGMDPSKLAYVLPYDQYYNLMNNAGFTDISEVGSDVVAGGRGINPRVSGVLGYFYGVPVVASEFFSDQIETAGAANTTAALLVHTPSFVIPRLRGVNIQSDFEVAKQRTAIVATQSLGFEKLEAAAATTAVRIAYE
jgi:YD repeat-containing protein